MSWVTPWATFFGPREWRMELRHRCVKDKGCFQKGAQISRTCRKNGPMIEAEWPKWTIVLSTCERMFSGPPASISHIFWHKSKRVSRWLSRLALGALIRLRSSQVKADLSRKMSLRAGKTWAPWFSRHRVNSRAESPRETE